MAITKTIVPPTIISIFLSPLAALQENETDELSSLGLERPAGLIGCCWLEKPNPELDDVLPVSRAPQFGQTATAGATGP